MPYVLQILSYICQFIFLCLLLIMILSCFIRLIRSRSNYDPDEDEVLIELRCLTATKQYIFGKTNINLGHGTYSMGTSYFSELRIAKTKTKFSGMMEVFESGECHLYINSGAIVINDEIYDRNTSDYVCLYPGDVFSIGQQTCMINSLYPDEDDEDYDENDDNNNDNYDYDDYDDQYDDDYNDNDDILNYNGYYD